MRDKDSSLRAMVRLGKQMEKAFDTALQAYGCVGCAWRDVSQRLELIAYDREMQIIGEQTDGAPPMERHGVRRECGGCRTPPVDPDAISDDDIPF